MSISGSQAVTAPIYFSRFENVYFEHPSTLPLVPAWDMEVAS